MAASTPGRHWGYCLGWYVGISEMEFDLRRELDKGPRDWGSGKDYLLLWSAQGKSLDPGSRREDHRKGISKETTTCSLQGTTSIQTVSRMMSTPTPPPLKKTTALHLLLWLNSRQLFNGTRTRGNRDLLIENFQDLFWTWGLGVGFQSTQPRTVENKFCCSTTVWDIISLSLDS